MLARLNTDSGIGPSTLGTVVLFAIANQDIERACLSTGATFWYLYALLRDDRKDLQWRIKRPKSVRTCHAFVMYPKEKNTAGNRVVTGEVSTWKSRVNATIPRVHSQLGNLCSTAPRNWPTCNQIYGGDR